jgi:hypothetical protein
VALNFCFPWAYPLRGYGKEGIEKKGIEKNLSAAKIPL